MADACDHKRRIGNHRSSALTVCHVCRDFLCSTCGATIDWYEGLCCANPGAQWRYCTKPACVEVEAAYHGLDLDEMVRCREALREKRVLRHLQDRGGHAAFDAFGPRSRVVEGSSSATSVTGQGTATSRPPNQRFIEPVAFVLDPGEACWCNLGKDCDGSHQVWIEEPTNICGFCGEEFQISATDPHFLSGRGPRCPTRAA